MNENKTMNLKINNEYSSRKLLGLNIKAARKGKRTPDSPIIIIPIRLTFVTSQRIAGVGNQTISDILAPKNIEAIICPASWNMGYIIIATKKLIIVRRIIFKVHSILSPFVIFPIVKEIYKLLPITGGIVIMTIIYILLYL